MIHVILGAPCSGKSTYVREHAQEGDVIVDYDAIARALGAGGHMPDGDIKQAAFKAREAAIGYCIESGCESWIIHTSPTETQREAYENAGAEFIEMETDMETCLERAEQDGRPPGTDQAIRDYYAAPKGAFFMPEKGGDMNLKTKTVEVKADNGSIKGYAATWTREPDSYGDVIVKGAFAESIAAIKAEGKAIPLLWNHDSGDLKSYIGTVTELAEDDHGLLFDADFDATDNAQRARELAADGRLCKVSFAYDVLDQGTVELEDGREANELRKLNIHEVSLVMYPANRDTSVVEVKSVDAAELMKQAAAEIKAGRRNSAKDADELNRILELCGSIQSIVNGLLAESREEPDEQESGDQAKANAEEPDTANAEELEANVKALLQTANQLLEKEV